MPKYILKCPECAQPYSDSPGDWREYAYGTPICCVVCGTPLHLMVRQVSYQTIYDAVTREHLEKRTMRQVVVWTTATRERLERNQM